MEGHQSNRGLSYVYLDQSIFSMVKADHYLLSDMAYILLLH